MRSTRPGRSATPTEFSGQIPLVHEVLDALKIRYIEAPGYEADDIIATLTDAGDRARAWRSSSSPATATCSSWSVTT